MCGTKLMRFAAGASFVWRTGMPVPAKMIERYRGSRAETNTPVPEIHLVYSNALAILRGTYSDGMLNQMPGAQRQTYLSRALGRALAHELGHFLFQSKVHSEGGLMRARQSADALFGPDRKSFRLTDDERRAAAARLFEGERLVRR